MEFKLNNLFPSNWLHAVGETLFYSLWLGILLSLLVAVIMFCTRKTSAALRYNLLTASFLLFVIGIGVVFYNALSFNNQVFKTDTISQIKVITKQQQIFYASNGMQNNLFLGANKIFTVWNTYAEQIVLIWFLIICAKSMQLLVSLNGVYHLKRSQVYAAGQKWDEILNLLATRLNIKQKVSILQSGIAKVPMVVGHLKPLILIPIGLLNNLSATQAEAIICHELAHIKRRDYLVNLLQSLIEIIFFFNPAVLWVSKLIRMERENCCDDLAINHVDDKKNYVNALITCQEFQLNAPRFAMAVTGKKNHLFQRISRMLFNTKSTLNKMEKTILTFALVSAVFCSVAFKNVAQAEPFNKQQTTNKTIEVLQDTTRKQKGLKHKLNNTDAEKEQAKYAKIQKTYDKEQVKYDKEQARYDREAQKYAVEAKLYAKHAEVYAREIQNYNKNVNKKSLNIPVPPSPPSPPAPPAYSSNVPPVPPTPPVYHEPAMGTKVTAKTEHTRSVSVTNGDGNDYTSEINDELLRDNIITSTNKLSYKLDKDNLFVNGVKQTASVHKKYKEKYLKKNDMTLVYNYDVNTSN